MTNSYLLFTSFLILLPLSLFYFKKNKNKYEYILALLLIINLILSLLFWSNPIKNSLIHKIDAFFARVSLIFFVIYILFFKENNIVLNFIILILFLKGIMMFFYSDKESSKSWCSKNHINYHMCFHLFMYLAAFYVFI